MSKSEFLTKLGEVLLAERPIDESTPLDSLSGWDSMGQVAVVSFLDEELDVRLKPGALQSSRTIGDILAHVLGKLNSD